MKFFKLLVMACSSLVLFNSTNYCYSMEELNTGWGNSPKNLQDNWSNFKSTYELSNDEIQNIKEIKDTIELSFNEYKNCQWYKDLVEYVNTIHIWFAGYLTPRVYSHPNQILMCKNILENVLFLPSMLFKYKVILTLEQSTLLAKFTNIVRKTFYALANTFRVYPMIVPKDTTNVDIKGNIV